MDLAILAARARAGEPCPPLDTLTLIRALRHFSGRVSIKRRDIFGLEDSDPEDLASITLDVPLTPP